MERKELMEGGPVGPRLTLHVHGRVTEACSSENEIAQTHALLTVEKLAKDQMRIGEFVTQSHVQKELQPLDKNNAQRTGKAPRHITMVATILAPCYASLAIQ